VRAVDDQWIGYVIEPYRLCENHHDESYLGRDTMMLPGTFGYAWHKERDEIIII